MQDSPSNWLLLNPADDVAVAVRDLPSGTVVVHGSAEFPVTADIPVGHKFAVQAIRNGAAVHKYGQVIGLATADIAPGDWVHTHNLGLPEKRNTARASEIQTAALSGQADSKSSSKPEQTPTFQGYRRGNGKAGTRNYIAVVSSVNCSASVSRFITSRFPTEELRQYPNVDGLLPLTHKGGCGIQYDGEAHQQLARVLAGFALHPNIGGFLLVGLGCETGTLSYIVEQGGLSQSGNSSPQLHEIKSWEDNATGAPPTLSIQECGGTAKTVEAGINAIRKMLPQVNDVRREAIPASELVVALECGGSDAWSGITANPALGIASDTLVAAGGTTILSETPEIYGAEQLLAARAVSSDVAEKLHSRVRWWEEYARKHGATLDNNPSTGNKAGGLSTIYEKSLGAVAKGGSAPLVDVLRYAEPVSRRGFLFMDSPGYDPASITGKVAAGANVVCFTTGRGSCFGCKPSPSIKIATNTRMYERMRDDMDLDAGVALAGTPLEEIGQAIFRKILAVASGEQTKSEAQGLGEEEFAPWDLGPTL